MQKIGENAYEGEQRELMWGEGQGELIRPGCRSDPLEGKKVLDCSGVLRKLAKVAYQRSPASPRNKFALVSLKQCIG